MNLEKGENRNGKREDRGSLSAEGFMPRELRELTKPRAEFDSGHYIPGRHRGITPITSTIASGEVNLDQSTFILSLLLATQGPSYPAQVRLTCRARALTKHAGQKADYDSLMSVMLFDDSLSIEIRHRSKGVNLSYSLLLVTDLYEMSREQPSS
jgi:hypothetical protein